MRLLRDVKIAAKFMKRLQTLPDGEMRVVEW
jgi:hypothetical protein